LVACADVQAADEAAAPSVEGLSAGTYALDPYHASLIFKVNHLGFSNYTARFTGFDATLELDPADPGAAELTATVDPASVETDFSDPEDLDFNSVIAGPEFLDAEAFPQMSYRSTAVTLTGPNTATIDGELTLHGVTAPVALEATFNGGWAGIPQDPNARIGFSVHGTLMRSAFGVDYGVPEPGSNMGVGDAVEVIIEAEFTGPPMEAE
jgi:polyisoprenoid-binding protein YceI